MEYGRINISKKKKNQFYYKLSSYIDDTYITQLEA